MSICADKHIEKKTRREKSQKMNDTESRFALILEAKKRRGEILDFRYEGMALRWGVTTEGQYMSYCADFTVFDSEGITLIEVKGAHIRDRDIVRYRGCRADWPQFRFEFHQYSKGEWRKVM